MACLTLTNYKLHPINGTPAPKAFAIWAKAARNDSATGRIQGKPIRTISIGVGSGLLGYSNIRLSSKGKLEVVWLDEANYKSYQTKTQVPVSIAAHILSSRVIQSVEALRSRYSSEVLDGSQGYLAIDFDESHEFKSFNNNFPRTFLDAWEFLRSFAYRIPELSWSAPRRCDPFSDYFRSKKEAAHCE